MLHIFVMLFLFTTNQPVKDSEPQVCLVVDSIVMMKPACASGNCALGPGVVTGVELKAAMIPGFEIKGNNASYKKKTGHSSTQSAITIAFYDKEGYRIGVGNLYVGPLDPAEKFSHTYEVPEDVRGSGVAVEG